MKGLSLQTDSKGVASKAQPMSSLPRAGEGAVDAQGRPGIGVDKKELEAVQGLVSIEQALLCHSQDLGPKGQGKRRGLTARLGEP